MAGMTGVSREPGAGCDGESRRDAGWRGIDVPALRAAFWYLNDISETLSSHHHGNHHRFHARGRTRY